MQLNPDHCYPALVARDSRFDGRFFVGVTSTGIYCRPICRAKTPKAANCRFFANAAQAELEGFRPCLRCRPELAPGSSSMELSSRLARAAAQAIEAGALGEADLTQLAERIGVTDRHLRRLFRAQFGVTPIQYAQTQRLLLAKRLLTDTTLSFTDIAAAAGFGSVRRFNALFKSRYRSDPTAHRRAREAVPDRDALVFYLGFRPPFDWQSLVEFLGKRAIPTVEHVQANSYRRSVRVRRQDQWVSGWIEVEPELERDALRVRLAPQLLPVGPAVLERVKALFDLACNPQEIAATLGPLAAARPGLRVPGAFDSFEMTVRAILGQQITVKAATTLAARFAARFGEPFATPFECLTHLFPTPAQIASVSVDSIAELGIINTRARAIINLARALDSGELRLGPMVDVDKTIAQLCELPGVGPWTAHYIAMRCLSWPDAFPASDIAVMKALGTRSPKIATQLAQVWQPWRAYAVMHLWNGASLPAKD